MTTVSQMAPPTQRTLILRWRARLAKESAKRRVKDLAEEAAGLEVV